MPLSSLDIVFYYTNNASQATNTLSLGGSISSNTIPDNVANNIFDDVTGDEASTGDTEYRAIAVKDTNSSYDMLNAKVYITGYTRAGSGYDTISFALEKVTGTTIQLVADESTAPNTVRFTTPVGVANWTVEGAPSATLSYGTLTAGNWFGLWLRRQVPAGATAYSNRSCTIMIECDTTASPIVGVIQKEFAVNWYDGGFGLKHLNTKFIPKSG